MEDMGRIREQFPVTENKVFLNHAAQSPLPKRVAETVHRYLDECSNFGTTSNEWNDLGKQCFAKLVNAKTEEIALVENTSVGLNIVANAIKAPHGSKIVTTDLEYPAVTYPFLRKSLGFKVEYVKNVGGKILLDDIARAVDDKTVAIALSQVEYSNGFRHDVRAVSDIAHGHGAYVVVDAIQAAGAVSVDVKRDGIDFLSTSCYKWLLSPCGAAYLYVKDDFIEKLEPPYAGWASVKQEIFKTVDFWDIWNLQYSETASKFEVGTPSYVSFIGAREAMKLLLNVGIDKIEKGILKLTDHLIDCVQDLGLTLQTPTEKQYRSGIVNFRVRNPQKMVEKLNEKGIVVSARSNGIRTSPHFYNTEAEIDTLIAEIKKSEG